MVKFDSRASICGERNPTSGAAHGGRRAGTRRLRQRGAVFSTPSRTVALDPVTHPQRSMPFIDLPKGGGGGHGDVVGGRGG